MRMEGWLTRFARIPVHGLVEVLSFQDLEFASAKSGTSVQPFPVSLQEMLIPRHLREALPDTFQKAGQDLLAREQILYGLFY